MLSTCVSKERLYEYDRKKLGIPAGRDPARGGTGARLLFGGALDPRGRAGTAHVARGAAMVFVRVVLLHASSAG